MTTFLMYWREMLTHTTTHTMHTTPAQVLGALTEHLDNLDVQQQGADTDSIRGHARPRGRGSPSRNPTNSCRQILTVFFCRFDKEKIARFCFSVGALALANLHVNSDEQIRRTAASAIKAVVDGMGRFSADAELQARRATTRATTRATRVVRSLSCDACSIRLCFCLPALGRVWKYRVARAKGGGAQSKIEPVFPPRSNAKPLSFEQSLTSETYILHPYPYPHPRPQEIGAAALANLAPNTGNQARVAAAGGIRAVIAAMRAHTESVGARSLHVGLQQDSQW